MSSYNSRHQTLRLEPRITNHPITTNPTWLIFFPLTSPNVHILQLPSPPLLFDRPRHPHSIGDPILSLLIVLSLTNPRDSSILALDSSDVIHTENNISHHFERSTKGEKKKLASTNTNEDDESVAPPPTKNSSITGTGADSISPTAGGGSNNNNNNNKPPSTGTFANNRAFYPTRSTTEKGHRISPTVVLGDSLGKGAFGVVYEAKNTLTGEVYAVKRVALRNLSPEQQKGFEQEVALLKVLNHPNIVKYIGFVKTRHHANVLLEYVEGGSLADNLKKFGNFTPPLVALYTRQVLKGCAYLHQQGVIHRDIKGANILCDKLGRVKLADFGVAVWAAPSKGKSDEVVVGTPYWMAPEIIEFHSPTTACDVWSIGCTVVELLTGKPPYFEVPQMAALYRIVQDVAVPIPAEIPDNVRAFLKLCFVKSPSQRPRCVDLMQHEWLKGLSSVQSRPSFSAVMEEEVNVNPGSNSSSNPGSKRESANVGSAAPSQMLQQQNPSTNHVRNASVSSTGSTPLSRPRHSLPGQVYEGQFQYLGEPGDRGSWRGNVVDPSNILRDQSSMRVGWDDEATTPTPLTSNSNNDIGNNNNTQSNANSSPRAPAWTSPSAQRVDKSALTTPVSIREAEAEAERRAVQGSSSNEKGKNPALASGMMEDDFGLNSKIASSSNSASNNTSANTNSKRGLLMENERAFEGDKPFHPNQKSSSSTTTTTAANAKRRESEGRKSARLARFRESVEDADFGFGKIPLGPGTNLNPNDGSYGVSPRGKPTVTTGRGGGTKRVTNNNDDEEEEEGGEPSLATLDSEASGRSARSKLAIQIRELIETVTGKDNVDAMLNATRSLVAMLGENQNLKRTLLTHHGITPLLRALEAASKVSSSQENLVMKRAECVLQMLVAVGDNDREFLEILAVAGLIPILTAVCGGRVDRIIRLPASRMVRHYLITSPLTLHMFVACGGLQTLVALLEPSEISSSMSSNPAAGARAGSPARGKNAPGTPTEESLKPDLDLAIVAIDGVQRVFAETVAPPGSSRRQSLSRAAEHFLGKGGGGMVPKTDFCAMFARTELLSRMVDLCEYLQDLSSLSVKSGGNKSPRSVRSVELFIASPALLNNNSNGNNKNGKQNNAAASGSGRKRPETEGADADDDTEDGVEESLSMRDGKHISIAGLLAEVCHLFTVFSQSEPFLAENPKVLKFVVQSCAIEWSAACEAEREEDSRRTEDIEDRADSAKSLLTSLKNVCANFPEAHDALDACGAVPTLCSLLTPRLQILSESHLFISAMEVHNLALGALFYLVRLSPQRQERCAASGAVPLLVQAVTDKTTVKSLALTMLCEFVGASDYTRVQLWNSNVFNLLLETTARGEPYWQERGLQALETWLLHSQGTHKEMAFVTPKTLKVIINLFQSSQREYFETVVKTLISMCSSSSKFAEAVSRDGMFVSELCARLNHPKAEVRLNLLRLLQAIIKSHPNLEALILDHNLATVVRGVLNAAKAQKQVVVASEAETILSGWNSILNG